jgi:HlyD family secretion protein
MVEKIEPQAVVQQSVTMFPVIISLDNNEGFLKPGMNGEVSMIVDRKDNVLAVANDAVRTVREAATAATFVGLNPDSVQAQVRAMQAQMGGGRGGNGAAAGAPAGDAPAAQAVDAQSGAAGRGAGRSGAAGRGAGRSGGADAGGRAGGMGAGKGGNAPTGGKALGAGMAGGRPGGVTRTRTALVFVQIGVNKYEPRLVKLGASNYDYAEVLSGLKDGDKVALLAVQALQAKRDQQNDRMRSMTGSGVPGMQRTPAAGGAAGGGAPAGGGAAGGGAPAGGGGARPPGGGR